MAFVGLALQASCASVIDRAERALERGESDRASALLDRSLEDMPPESRSLRVVLLQLELDIVARGSEAPIEPAIERLTEGSPSERASAAAGRLGGRLLSIAEDREDSAAWARVALALPDNGTPRLAWLPGLLGMMEADHHRGAVAFARHLGELDQSDRRSAITAADLWLYQIRPGRPFSQFLALLHALGASDAPAELRVVLLRHELFATLERNRTPSAELVGALLESSGQTTAQLAAEAGLRGLHRASRALWVATARESDPEVAIPALRQAAESAYLQNDVRGARQLLDESVLYTPRALQPLLDAVQTAVARGDRAFAELLLDRAIVGAPCEELVPLALPRLRLQVGRADDVAAIEELRQTAARCEAPSLLDEGAAHLARHAPEPLALALLEESLDAGSRHEGLLRAWGALAPPDDASRLRLLRAVEALPADDAIVLARELAALNAELAGPLLLDLQMDQWRTDPGSIEATRALLEHLLALADPAPGELLAVTTGHLAASPTADSLAETAEFLIANHGSHPGALDVARALIEHATAEESLPPSLASRLLRAEVIVLTMLGETDFAVSLLQRSADASREPPRLDPSVVAALPPADRVSLFEAGVRITGDPDRTEAALAEALHESGRADRAMAMWASMADRTPEVVERLMLDLAEDEEALAAQLGRLLPTHHELPAAAREERLLLYLGRVSATSGLERTEWLGRARRDALDLLEDRGTLRRESIEHLRALGQVDLSSDALRNEMLSGTRTRRTTVIQWVEDRLAAGDDEAALRSVVRDALADASPIERMDISRRLGAAGAISLAREIRTPDGDVRTDLRAPSPDLVEREIRYLLYRGDGERAEELVGATLLDPALALVTPHPFDDPPEPADAARAVRWGREAAERYGELGRADLSVRAWALVLKYGPAEERRERLDEAIASLTRPGRTPLEPELLEMMVGHGGEGLPSLWAQTSSALERAGEQELALHATLRAAALLPRDHSLRQRAGRIHDALGQREQAIVAWEHALALAPTSALVDVLVDLHQSSSRGFEQHGALPAFLSRARLSGDETLEGVASLFDGAEATFDPAGAHFVLLLMLDRGEEALAGWRARVPMLDDREATSLLRTWGRPLRELVDERRWVELLELHRAAGIATETAERQLALVHARAGDPLTAAHLLTSSSGTAVAARAGWLLRAGETLTPDERASLLREVDLHQSAPALLHGELVDEFLPVLWLAAERDGAGHDVRVLAMRVAIATAAAEDIPVLLEEFGARQAGLTAPEFGAMLVEAVPIRGGQFIAELLDRLPAGPPGPTEMNRLRIAGNALRSAGRDAMAEEVAAHRHAAGDLLEVELRVAEILVAAELMEAALEVLSNAWEGRTDREHAMIAASAIPVAHALGPQWEAAWVARAVDLRPSDEAFEVIDALALAGRLEEARAFLERVASTRPTSPLVRARELLLVELEGTDVTGPMRRDAKLLLVDEPHPPAVQAALIRLAQSPLDGGGGEDHWRTCLDRAEGGVTGEAAARCALIPPSGGGVFDGVERVLDALATTDDPEAAVAIAREAFPAAFLLPGLAGDGVRAPALLLGAGHVEEARLVAARAVALEPGNWRAHAALSRVLDVSGDERGARWHASRAAALGGAVTRR